MAESAAKTYRSYHDFVDPMLRAGAAEAGGLGADTLRWMGYADQELARLRGLLRLPLSPGYAAGRPQYKDDDAATVERVALALWIEDQNDLADWCQPDGEHEANYRRAARAAITAMRDDHA